jgi:Fungal specific transcription factor domain/Fungal Zn(2)-Cys(6) binuclear cluster domain
LHALLILYENIVRLKIRVCSIKMDSGSATNVKRPRQGTACNWCRSHKLKCDAEQPSCHNCRKRGIECVTTNLRRQGAESQRLEPLGRHKKRNSTLSHFQQPESSCSPSHPSIFAVPFNDITRQQQTSDDGSRQSTADISSQEQTSTATSLTLVTDKSSSRRQMIGSGSSMYVLVQWLDLFFAKQGNWDAIFPYFQQSLAYSMEVPLSFPISLPPLPSPDETKEYISIFFTRIYPVFPILDKHLFTESVEYLREKLTSQLDSKDYPALACAYAVFSAAADEADGHPTGLGTQYLEGAYVLYAHIVAIPYLTSVQALLLLVIVLRNRGKDGASWGILGQAIRIAQSTGLHRHVSSSPETDDLHSRIWWTAYILERIMELETGRPSAIRDDECDQILPKTHSSNVYFGGLIRLSKIQTRAINLLYGNKHRRKSTKEILLEMGRIDRALMDWANEFPDSIK